MNITPTTGPHGLTAQSVYEEACAINGRLVAERDQLLGVNGATYRERGRPVGFDYKEGLRAEMKWFRVLVEEVKQLRLRGPCGEVVEADAELKRACKEMWA